MWAKAEGLYFNVTKLQLLPTCAIYLARCAGVHTRPLPNDPRGREVAPKGPAVQGPHQPNRLHTPTVFQGGRGFLNVQAFFPMNRGHRKGVSNGDLTLP